MKIIIDPHVHLFDLEQGQYDWLKPEFPPQWLDKNNICNSYNDTDLQQQTAFSIAGYVHIEAGFDNKNGHRELTNVENRASLPQRSIGFIDITLAPKEFIIELDNQWQHHSAAGIRHIVEAMDVIENSTDLYKHDAKSANDLATTTLLGNKNSFINLGALEKRNGIFELQCDVNNRQLVVQIFSFFQHLPNLQLVLNHAGFAPPASDLDGQPNSAFSDWKINSQLLARLPNIAVKCSGFEMLERGYKKSQIHAVLAHCIDVFGHANVMLASNFPLCELAFNYDDYWQRIFSVLEQMIAHGLLDAKHEKALYFDNAFRIYEFSKTNLSLATNSD
ncbi:MAG: putative TIM-barrel fold metal-dependent hydrolase [Bermanella sp.]|jgi:predicted TIM-barrel fold metal-dependent hydrolase|uniref:amidohydrolase family protein n=1 Tax=Glaciecola sp. 33A TaxID=2057807 RepID=UPI000C334FCD|nr:amidohydrolase family protein [Glaciecola sp. 33A]PKI02794.1 amidohydrolase [Glaciecola sp. 33A]